jgi:hypothetical protein
MINNKKNRIELHMMQQFHFEYTLQRSERRSCRHICALIFITALFTVTKTWEQLKCPLKDEWISKMRYIHNIHP